MNMINFLASDWNFNLDNYQDVWHILVQSGLILICLLIGNVLRNIIPFFKKFLVPSALLGGALLLILDFIVKWCGGTLVDQRFMQVVTYHGLGIGFVAMTLKTPKKEKQKPSTIKVVENGLLTGGTYMLQAFVGIAITVIFYLCYKGTSKEIFYDSGVILPLGFGQGPGNALTWDMTFTNLASNFSGNGSFGLTIASVGFIVASVVGVVYINVYKKLGKITKKEANETVKTIDHYEEENEIPDNESVDKFSIQLGFVFLAYALAFGIMCIFGVISDFTNGIAWGFNFIWGVITANLIKLLLKALKKTNAVKRIYINNYQMDRISGFAFDVMIVAGVAAIDINDVARYIVPIIVLCSVGTVVTFIYVKLVTKYCFSDIRHETFVTNFGTLTGTASNGMILLKEIDPNFDTPTSSMFVASQLPAMVFVAPLLLLLNFSCKSFTNTMISLAIFFVLWLVYTIFLFRKRIFKKKNK